MKIIGDVVAKFNEEGEGENGDYLGGCIVMLRQREMSALRQLQDAANGHQRRFPGLDINVKPDDIKMDHLFWLVRCFAEAKFAINEFKGAIDRLDDMLLNGGGGE